MENIVSVIVAALISGLLATVITIWWQRKASIRKSKMNIFETLMAYRYSIVAEPSVQALNSIDVIFYKDKNVRWAYEDFLREANKSPEMHPNTSDKHLKLLEEMAKALGLKNIHWNDIKQVYCPNGLFEKLREEDLLRKMQIQSATHAIELQKEQQNTPSQEQVNQQLVLQILPELMKNPDSLKLLMEIGEKHGKKTNA